MAKVDTGASFCLFQRACAETLGLQLESGVRQDFVTANSRFEAFGHELTLRVLGLEMESTVYFFVDSGISLNVPGRHGWLDRIRMGVVEHDQMLFLSHYDD